jgi:hypothetical protein
VRIPVDSANDLVITPLSRSAGDPVADAALRSWKAAGSDQQTGWATAYGDALAAAPDGDPTKAAAGDYGPVPLLADRFLTLARSGALQGLLLGGNFYASDQTKPLLLLADGAYLEDQARADHLGGDQWGMMNETGNYPGQPWLWLYTFWYQIKPFSDESNAWGANADAIIFGIMVVLSLGLMLLPFIPGLRSVPRWIPVHRYIWREWYREHGRT